MTTIDDVVQGTAPSRMTGQRHDPAQEGLPTRQ
jgi:hypothetical protein